jgi:glycerate-2-kinase
MQKIKNFHELSSTELRVSALRIAEVGLRAIDTSFIIEKNIKVQEDSIIVGGVPFRGDKGGKVFFVGIGKCSGEAGLKIEEILGEKLTAGIVLDVKEIKTISQKVKYYSGTHPFPSQKNVDVASEIVSLLKTAQKEDLVIFVISGGGSTLLCLPSNGGTCVEEETILKRLFSVGANIQEINTIRKHISFARGGHFARFVYPARAVALIFSDVPGNDLSSIASGPTVLDSTTIKDAENILHKYEILETCNLRGCGLIETPKDQKYFENLTNILVVSNILALNAMHDEAKKLNFEARIVTDKIEGEARDVGVNIVNEIRGEKQRTCLLYGGETTVTVDKKGRGGRNGELALSALRYVEQDELVMAIASDGRDNGEYGGALADKGGRQKAHKLGLDFEKHLENHDPAPFFEQTGDYLMMGNTGSNVSDLLIAIKN